MFGLGFSGAPQFKLYPEVSELLGYCLIMFSVLVMWLVAVQLSIPAQARGFLSALGIVSRAPMTVGVLAGPKALCFNFQVLRFPGLFQLFLHILEWSQQ